MKKQTKILDNLDSGEQNESGGVDNRRDYCSMLIKRLQDDIDGVMGICRKVMTLNMKKNSSSKDQDDQNWTLMKQQIINEAMKVLVLSQDPCADKFMLISKLLNLRENLMR